MKTKVCCHCKEEKPLSEFYVNKSKKDGYTHECKECIKARMRANYLKKSKDPAFIEKERARGRDKYYRLGYKTRITESQRIKQKKYPSLRNAKRYFNVNISADQELHHWNYNITNEVILLDKKLHHRFHSSVSLDIDNGFYYRGEEALDTLNKHLSAIKEFCDKFDFDFSQVKVLRK